MAHYSFPKRHRLLRPREFDHVFEKRCSQADGILIVYGRPNQLGHARLGLVVSRKAGNAVCRNRWKRTIREAFRLNLVELPALDLICLPHPKATPDFQQLMQSLPRLAKRVEHKLNREESKDAHRKEPS